ncbi:phosphoglycolate phosphatase [Streptomyces sp. TverLS-915]|uniref:HAD family hydrolase n=1 Tax=Streptomyces sp. TverLS-915 TaxID=1839763 RepID=UPI00081DF3C8|nr:HAD family hydrolase [Streptomyces sp. TverLS-915]SCD93526.1 phosphoglycolate phosphatase [Streptomyces sp. TverLS-915]
MPQDIAPSDLATSQNLAADTSAVPLSETTDGGPVVGFDLDMTLVDSRRGIGAVYRALAAETGADIDVDLVTSRLGPPLEHEMANWFPPEQVVAMSDRYRALYPEHAIADTTAMPGAREAIAAVRAAGGRVLVVTAKNRAHAALHLSHLGLEPDLLIGGLWAEAKGTALRAQGASVYVGDHIGDVRGARTADAVSVAVATGPCDEEELRAAGADVVLGTLDAFAGWLGEYVGGAGEGVAGGTGGADRAGGAAV